MAPSAAANCARILSAAHGAGKGKGWLPNLNSCAKAGACSCHHLQMQHCTHHHLLAHRGGHRDRLAAVGAVDARVAAEDEARNLAEAG